jgi:hypothetical protein
MGASTKGSGSMKQGKGSNVQGGHPVTKSRNFGKTAIASAVALASSMASAGTATNNMTSIATVADACDIVGIGVDFGVTTVPLPAAGLTSVTPNTSIGNASTGNTANPQSAADGSTDDTLSLNAPDAIGTAINTVLAGVSLALPGVYVACTSAPTAITVTSGSGATHSLPVAIGGTPTGSLAGKMSGVGGGAAGTNQIDYTLTFLGSPVSTAVAGLPTGLFVGSFTATGGVPAAQSGTVVPGYYADVATAQVDF